MSLKRKIQLIFAFFLITNSIVWFLSYYNYYLGNRQIQLMYFKNDILNTILEARRYEKNYFIHGGRSNIKEALFYTGMAQKGISKIENEFPTNIINANFINWKKDLQMYEESLARLLEGDSKELLNKRPNDKKIREETTELGHKITADLESIVKLDRKQVTYLMEKAGNLLILAIIEIIVISLFTAILIFFAVGKPLKQLEKAIKMISRGDYENIPNISSSREIFSLIVSLNNMIEEINRRRTDQLIQMKKMASLGILTSGVAHELNNPINNISTSCQILLEELEEDNLDFKREQLIEMEKQVERTRKIIKALLEFSREKTFSLSETSISELVDNTIKLVKGEVPSNVEIVTNIPDNLRAEIDPNRIQQALINLFLNAIQAMSEGGVLTIEAYEVPENSTFRINVQDTGRGIPEENLSKIFDRFFTTKEVVKGTGLGLSIVHEIVKQHRGKISVKSKVGEGTTFIIELPLGSISGGR